MKKLFISLVLLSASVVGFAQQVTAPEPEFIGSYCMLTSDSTYVVLPKENGKVEKHQNKFSKFSKIAGAVSDLGFAGGMVGLSTGSMAGLETGVRVMGTAAGVGLAADAVNTLAGVEGTVVCAGGGVGVAPLLPIVEAFHKAGNRVIVVLAARTKDLVILEEQMRQNSDEVIIMTDDGSYGMKGLVTNGVESVINRERVDLCVTIGPAIMMKFVSALTKKYEIPTVASLNTIMVDGTGMCGACRITVGGKTKFVCVDGPEFDAHQVDFDEMIMRLGAYKDIEKK